MAMALGAALILSLLGSIALAILFFRERVLAFKFSRMYDKSEEQSQRLSAEVSRLQKWSHIANVGDECERMKADAANTIAQAETDARVLLSSAQAHYDKQTEAAKAITKDATRKAELLLKDSMADAAEIQTNAARRAKEIGESAFLSAEKIDLNRKAAQAFKNRIDGYGIEYLRPSGDLVDDLAADYGHKEAGRSLKVARATSKSLVSQDLAASCDYTEQLRADRAKALVLDSFNGKVDAILAKVRHNNHGTLEQQIHDAFATVNFGGRAFRNARISETYLNSRLLELKWAATVQELKRREQEEQRAIRDQIREEQKAQREFEKARKAAELEERLLHEAMERVRAELGTAADEQRAEHEAALAELESKLREAEERNMRAISMAQQTRQGHVYIISNVGSFGEGVYKIGLTRRLDPLERVKELGDASVPFGFDVHAVLFSEDAPALETSLHKKFVLNQVNKVNRRKEFFTASLAQIRAATEEMGIEARWTMVSEAQEFRESQAIAMAIENDPIAREQWLNRQFELDPALLEEDAFEELADSV